MPRPLNKLQPKRAKLKSVRKSHAESGDGEGRKQIIMREAARLFATHGFEATSIREIAASSGILGGSIYHHFPSKEDIFVAVHTAGMESMINSLIEATRNLTDPWQKLENAAVAHANALLTIAELPLIISPYYSWALAPMRDRLVAQRDRYESLIEGIIEELDLPADIDRKIFRLYFLGALNWMPTWYRANGRSKSQMSAADIARQLIRMVRPTGL